MEMNDRIILTCNTEEVARVLKLSIEEVYNYFIDGRRISFLIERSINVRFFREN